MLKIKNGVAYHVTMQVGEIEVKNLDDNHLHNIIEMIKLRAKAGIVVKSFGGNTPDDYWFEETTLHGKKARNVMGYEAYKVEQKRRTQIKNTAQ
jgi:hypothetical protein